MAKSKDRATIVATPRPIDTSRAFFRHDFDDQRLLEMLKTVVRERRWALPPPLVVSCARDGMEYSWVLDGHHRIHTANILASNELGSGQLWAYCVDESDYNDLIRSRFDGVEPAYIGAVREHIMTPIGTANLIDENWRLLRKGFTPGAYAHRPFYVYEKHGKLIRNVGHLNLRNDHAGTLALRNQSEVDEIIRLDRFEKKKPPKPRKRKALIDAGSGDPFELALSLGLDASGQALEVNSDTKGLMLSDRWLGHEAGSNDASDTVYFRRETFYYQMVLLYMSLRIKGQLQPVGRKVPRRRLRHVVPAHLLEMAPIASRDGFLFSDFREIFRQQRDETGRGPRCEVS